MPRSHKPLLAVCGAVAAAGLLVPAPAGAAAESFKDLVLSGTCLGQSSDLKSVVTVPKSGSLWAPLQLVSGETFQPLKKWLQPHEISVRGDGLKARHLLPGEVITKPGKPPKNPVTCEFEGATKEEGAFQVTIIGALRPPEPAEG